eukprot:3274524-Alexandrium_andersonii.AAC.1
MTSGFAHAVDCARIADCCCIWRSNGLPGGCFEDPGTCVLGQCAGDTLVMNARGQLQVSALVARERLCSLF